MPKAAIFDASGTLVDSVDPRASAWQEAVVKFGHQATFEQAPGQIGKGGDQLISVFLSDAEQADHGEAMEEWRGKLFKSNYMPDSICRWLLTVPGVGPVTALAYATAIDDPARFHHSRDVGAHLGLTPRKYGSGDRPQRRDQ